MYYKKSTEPVQQWNLSKKLKGGLEMSRQRCNCPVCGFNFSVNVNGQGATRVCPGCGEKIAVEALTGEIMAFIAEQVAPHKKIRQVEITDEIPKSLAGKILRRVLIEGERKEA